VNLLSTQRHHAPGVMRPSGVDARTPKQTRRKVISQIECWLILATALAFVTQPLNIRLAGYGIPVILILLTMTAGIISRPKIFSPKKLAIIAIPIGILLVMDFLLKGQFRSANFLVLLLFATLYSDQKLPDRYIDRVWAAIGVICLILTIFGAYRFLVGYQGEKSQNVGGFYDVVNQYVYFGISYLPSTRNSDALYFGAGALVFLWRFSKNPRFMSLDLLGFLITAGGAALSLSRGIWVALFLAVLLSYDLKRISKIIPTTLVLAIGLALIGNEFLISLMKNALISLFDEGSANVNVSGYYTYSNRLRIETYAAAIGDFISYPFGHGVSFVPSYGVFTGATSVASENLYLDFLIVFGVFALPFFWQGWMLIVRTRRNTGPYASLIRSIAILLALYTMFNGGMDFAFFWFLLTLLLVTECSTRFRHPTPSGTRVA
jgi:hypothetical protein